MKKFFLTAFAASAIAVLGITAISITPARAQDKAVSKAETCVDITNKKEKAACMKAEAAKNKKAKKPKRKRKARKRAQ